MKGDAMKRIVLLLLALLLLGASGCTKKAPVVDPIADNNRVFYQIFVGSFSDSDGDGTGDLGGVLKRMDYLNDGDIASGESLGVQGIWLSPIFKSPSYHKYDVTDYYAIDSAFGSEQDLVDLLTLCHARNVKVILDLPLNHTSNSNLWFLKFCNAHKSGDATDPYYDWYTHVSADERLGGHTYHLIDGCTDDYYECNFSTDMPELNFDNDAVRQAAVEVARYYLALGVDGFRFDAVKYIYYADTPRSTAFWSWYMAELRAISPEIYCVGECWSADTETLQYVESVNCFDFQMAQAEGYVANAVKGTNMGVFTKYVESYSAAVQDANADGMMISFVSNHDMDRASGYLLMANKWPHMAANLYLLCCGSSFLYYGEEIGMKGSRGGSGTDANRRLAMLWGDGDTVKDPVGTTYDRSKQTNGTVTEQQKDEDSLLRYYGKVIALRNKYPAIARGSYRAVLFDETRFGGFCITYEGMTIGLFHNTSTRTLTIALADNQSGCDVPFSTLQDSIGQGDASFEDGVLTIGPQTSVILG